MGAGVAGACVLVWLLALSVYDIRERRLPNWLTVPGGLVIIGAAAVTGHGVSAVLGAAGLAVLYLVVHLVAPAALGAGDVKLAVGIGGLTGAFGYDVWVLAAIAAPLCTAVLAAGASIRRAESAVPHGPSMCVSTVAALALVVV